MRRFAGVVGAATLAVAMFAGGTASADHGDCAPGPSRSDSDVQVQQPDSERYVYADADPTDGHVHVGSDNQTDPKSYLEVEVDANKGTVAVHGENRGAGTEGDTGVRNGAPKACG